MSPYSLNAIKTSMQIQMVLVSLLCACSLGGSWVRQCAVGLSGAIFGLIVVDNATSGATTRWAHCSALTSARGPAAVRTCMSDVHARPLLARMLPARALTARAIACTPHPLSSHPHGTCTTVIEPCPVQSAD